MSQADLIVLERIAARFTRVGVGHHAVYLVLLKNLDGRGADGLYVGLTGLTPEERFANHKAGHKSSRCVRDHGVGVLPVGKHLRGMSYEDAVRIEKDLHRALVDAGICARGGH